MGDQTTPDRPSSYFQISTSIYLNQKKKKKREIRVKSTKLKYKNKGLKSKSVYEHNLHIHPVLWSRMTAL